MARLSALQKFTRTFKEAYGSRAVTTERGQQGWEQSGTSGKKIDFSSISRPENSLTYEVPTRNQEIAYIVQEMYAVWSPFSRAIHQLAGDATQDSMADTQPYTIMVRESNPSRKKKIKEILETTFRDTGLGVNGEPRIRRMLKTGDAIGQPIFELDGSRWHLTKVKIMPTWQMHYDPRTGQWIQRKGGMQGRIIAKWDIPDFMARCSFLPDENFLYGIPIGQLVIADFRAAIMSLEDVIVAGRTRAAQRLKHMVGNPKFPTQIEDTALQAYKARVEADPLTIPTDYWLKEGFENIEPIGGDAAGIDALLKIHNSHVSRMRLALGLPSNPEDMSGRGLESVDADYARNINTLRIQDFKFLKSIGDKALLLEGYDDVDWSTQIPPIGETETVRWDRANKALQWGALGYEDWCGIVGLKDPEEAKLRIKDWMEFRKELGIPLVMGDKEIGDSNSDTENPDRGKDPQKGVIRRSEKRRAGQNPPSGV